MHIRTTIVALTAIASLTLTSCEKTSSPPPPSTPAPESQQSEVKEPEPAPPVASAATSTPVTAPPAATPPPSHLAPEGVYFLTRAVSVETADGIVGLSPGTQAVRQADGRYLADGHSVELLPSQITNDLRMAQHAAVADQAAQQKIRQALMSPSKTASATPPPSSDQALPTVPQPPAKQYIEGVDAQGGLQSSTGLGSQHTRTGEGFLWQKSPDGQWWVPVKRLNGKAMTYIPPKKKV